MDEKEFIPLNLRTPRAIPDEKEAEEERGGLLYLLLFVCLFIFFMMVSGIYVEKFSQIQQTKVEIGELELVVQGLEEEIQAIRDSIESLKTQDGQERIARRKLKLIRPEEYIVEWEPSND